MFSACKNESNPGFIGSVNKENQFAPIEGVISFKFKTEDSLNLVVARLNHQNEYCSLHLYLEYKKKVIDKITLPKLLKQCNPDVVLKEDFKEVKSVVFPEAKTVVGLISFKLANGSTYDLLVGQSNRKLLKLEETITFPKDMLLKNTLNIKDTFLTLNTSIINKISNTEISNTTKKLEIIGNGVVAEQKAFPITNTVFKHVFKTDKNYTYSIEKTLLNRRESVHKSILRKQGVIVDSNILKTKENYIEILYAVNKVKKNYTNFSIGNVQELVEITNDGLGETWDVYGYSNMLFGYTSNNTLINELYTESEGGNTESDFSGSYQADETFNIPTANTGFNNRLIINKIGNETVYNVEKDDQEGKTTHVYNIDEVYDFKDGKFTKDSVTGFEAYVDAKNGLSVREKPGFTERIDKLDYNTRVKIIARSKIDFKLKEGNNKTVTGRWCKILYDINKTGYVFDGFLRKI